MDRLNERWAALKSDASDRVDELMQRIRVKELYEKEMENDRMKRVILTVLAALGIVACVAGIAFAVYKFMSRDYLEDYEDDFDDDFLLGDSAEEEGSEETEAKEEKETGDGNAASEDNAENAEA